MAIYLPELGNDPAVFPAPEHALQEPNGLLAYGGDLSPARLLAAYRRGIFPWFNPGEPILWWSPDPRCVLAPGQLHLSRSLQKYLRKVPLEASVNQAFDAVIEACSERRVNQSGTWLSQQMIQAYRRLHKMGDAHSVEIWHQQQLVGGLYGVTIGRCFFGESMFHRQSNASKAALLCLIRLSEQFGIRLIDCQITNPHLLSLGAHEIPRQRFMQLLATHCAKPLTDADWRPRALGRIR